MSAFNGAVRRRQRKPEEKPEREEWIYSYADMVTLLLLFFVLMFSVTKGVSEEKVKQVRDGLTSAGLISTPESALSKSEGWNELLKELRGAHSDIPSGAPRVTHVQPSAESALKRELESDSLRVAGKSDEKSIIERIRTEMPELTNPDQFGDEEQSLTEIRSLRFLLRNFVQRDGSLLPEGQARLQAILGALKYDTELERLDVQILPGIDSYADAALTGNYIRRLKSELAPVILHSFRMRRKPEAEPTSVSTIDVNLSVPFQFEKRAADSWLILTLFEKSSPSRQWNQKDKQK